MHIVYYVEKTLVDIVLKIRHEIALYSIQNVKKESCVHFSCVSLTFMSDMTGLKQCTLNERGWFSHLWRDISLVVLESLRW